MTKRIPLQSLRIAALFVFLAGHAFAGELTLTFIGNEAFHITDGETTLLSDFPYKSGAFGYMDYEKDQIPPIKNGLSLITHSHPDHWDRELFIASDLSIVGPPGVTAHLDPTRVVAMQQGRPSVFRDLEIQAIKTPHRLSLEHYSYLVTWHGLRLYFPGDTETPADLLQQHDIDILFITPWLVHTLESQKLKIDAKLLVVYHQRADERIPDFQERKVMKQGEAIRIPFDPSGLKP